MTDINNLTGLEKPLTKLVETISEGLGVIGNDIFKFDAKKIKRIGKAESEVEKLKIVQRAEGDARALGIMERAGNRFALEQYNKQVNLENIAAKTKQILEGEMVSDTSVNKDWTARFLGVAQDVSREDIQDVLAKILAGEVIRPSTFSLRTLEMIKNISSDELKAFASYVEFSVDDFGVLTLDSPTRSYLSKYNLMFDEYVQLTDMGLFNPSTSMNISSKLKKDETAVINVAGTKLTITNNSDKENKFKLNMIKYTDVGAQLAGILTDLPMNEKRETYLEDVKNAIISQGFGVS